MNTIPFKLSTSALLIAGALLTGCASDGEDGINGTDGSDGAQGTQGIQGEAGVAGQNAMNGFDIHLVGRALLGADSPEGAAEIVQYHSTTQSLYAINSSGDATVEQVDISGLTSEALTSPLTASNLNASPMALPTSYSVAGNEVALGDANSIAIHGDLMAVAMAADAHADNGAIIFYNGLNTSTPTYLSSVEVGNLPDMVTFTPDGTKVIVANEGEPNGNYSVDPEGSIAVIKIANEVPEAQATIIDFTAYNGKQAELEEEGLRFPNPTGKMLNGALVDITVSQDLEPEYISATNEMAYVSLQENNGLAIVDLSDNSVDVVGLGYKDWSGLDIDVSDKDGGMNFKQFDGLYGMYQPDTIATFSWQGATFIVTSNEGDGREYIVETADEAACNAIGDIVEFDDGDCIVYTDESRVKDLNRDDTAPVFADYDKDVIGRLKVSNYQGEGDNGFNELYTYGARSFSIWDQNGLMVFDSGDQVGRITASIHGEAFNNDEDVNEGDTRSDAKGAEPEALALGEIDGRHYAFVGLERMGGIMMYDVTNPYNVSFVDYFINRGTTEGEDIQGDLAPEGMAFIHAEQSPTGNAMLAIGNEISGTVSVWEISPR